MRWLLVLLLFLTVVARVYGSDDSKLASNRQFIKGSWYCPRDNSYSRFDFGDSTFMWFGYDLDRHSWTPYYGSPSPYTFRSALEIQPGSGGNSTMSLQFLSASVLTFDWRTPGNTSSYQCTRVRPAGDTDSKRTAVEAARKQKLVAFLGRWTTEDGTSYVVFRADNTCEWGGTSKGKSWTNQGKTELDDSDASCGGVGMYRKTINALEYINGAHEDPIVFHKEGTPTQGGIGRDSHAGSSPGTAAAAYIKAHFSHCGDSFYLEDYIGVTPMGLREYRGLHSSLQPLSITAADKLNGVTGKVRVTLSATANRQHSPYGGTWTEWMPGFSTMFTDPANATGVGTHTQAFEMVHTSVGWKLSGAGFEMSKPQACGQLLAIK